MAGASTRPATARYQRTVAKEFTLSGMGVHSGTWSQVTVCPAPANTGIVFRSRYSDEILPALVSNTTGSRFQTCISNGAFSVGTIEHLMSALSAKGVDNAQITIIGSEIPIMDGSVHPWLDLIESHGTPEQDARQKRIRVLAPVSVSSGTAHCMLSPPVDEYEDGLFIQYQLVHPHPMIGNQELALRIDDESFGTQLANARTFGFLDDLPFLRPQGLALGAGLDNTVVFSSTGVVNAEGLRWPDEPVRHKIVDAVGDLFLAGYPIAGCFYGINSGHGLNQDLVKKLLNSPGYWTME